MPNIKVRYNSLLSLIFCFSVYSEDSTGIKLAERIPYSIPLLKLSIMENNTAVRISKTGSEDYSIISNFSDISVKNSRSKTDKVTYHESADKSYYLTDFEARQVLIVTKSFIATLEEFEKNLQNNKWGQCLYLDGFLPKFIRGFYMLLGVSRNNTVKYSNEIDLFENEFDVSLNSPRSDMRVAAWRNTPESVLKLRIATKELIYQLRLWEKRELSNQNRNPEITTCIKCEEALNLFVRIYFSLKIPAFCSQGEKKKFTVK